jgi:hypothetical protein
MSFASNSTDGTIGKQVTVAIIYSLLKPVSPGVEALSGTIAKVYGIAQPTSLMYIKNRQNGMV